MKKAVVTGGAGFIGSHLVDALLKKRYAVLVIDNLSTGRLENIAPLLESVEFIGGSVTDIGLLRGALEGADLVFHLAAIASVPKSIADPITSHEVNVGGTLNVLLAAAENNVKKVVFSSSSAVYGESPGGRAKEDMLPSPLSPYAAGKLAAEYYCTAFSHTNHIQAVALRYFNVYGPRQSQSSDYAAVIPAFIKRIANNEPPVIYGDGEQTRDFVFVKDVVAANILAAETDMCGVYNIGSGTSVSINELAHTIMRITGNAMAPVYQDARAGDILISEADISKAEAAGYKPKHTIEKGLSETIKWLTSESRV